MTEDADPDDSLGHDTMAGLTNMVIGCALSARCDRGCRFDWSPPTAFPGGPVAVCGGAAATRAALVETLVLTLRAGLGDAVLRGVAEGRGPIA